MIETSSSGNQDHLETELQSLRHRIEQLEMLRQKKPARQLRRRLMGMLLIMGFAVLLLAVMGAQNKPDALFIDSNGNVGINQTNPQAPLDINGNAVVRGQMTVTGNEEVRGQIVGPLDVKDKAIFRARITPNDHISPDTGLVAGSSDFYFTDTQHRHTGLGNTTNFAAIENSQDYNALMILGRTTPLGRIVNLWDRVGIGMPQCNPQTVACAPQSSLDVRGDVQISGAINGEKPRMIFRIPATRGARWGVAERDIGPLCADEDGCHLKLVMQDVTNDQVKTVEEWIVIEQKGISNVQPGLRGYTRQSAGGESEWRLDTPELVTLFSPWNWCYAQNFRHEWAYGSRSAALRGTTIDIMCHPNINALVIIYDR